MQNILDYYKRLRGNGANASKALELARKNMAANRPYWELPETTHIILNPQGTDGLRWVENAASGLRFTGYCDKIRQSIGHSGWFTDDDGADGTLRGVVYQLPARKGVEQYISGYADPHNEGAARLDFTRIHNDKNEAAYHADRTAEACAETEREYNEAWQAGQSYYEAGEELAEERKATLQLIHDMKQQRQRGATPAICTALQGVIKSSLRTIGELKEKRATLLDDFSAGWRRDVWSAFNDGAQAQLIGGEA